MAGLGKVNVHIKDAVKDMAIQVVLRGVKTFSFRWWVALQLIKLAAKIAPIAVDLIHKQENMYENDS